jgi:uridylate kinase
VILVGTGNPISQQIRQPFCVVEIHADVILKGTRVDGVYDSDRENASAVKFDTISFDDVTKRAK